MEDSSQMLSLPPEPPDIRNWFCSYESPPLSESEGSFRKADEEEDGKVVENAKVWLKNLQFLGEDETVEAKDPWKTSSVFYRGDDEILEARILNKRDSMVSASEKIAAAAVEALPHELNSDADCASNQTPTSSLEDQKEPESDELTRRISEEERTMEVGRASREQRTDDVLSPKETSQMYPKRPLANSNLETRTCMRNDGFISTKKKRENYGFGNKEVAAKNKNQKILLAQNNGDSPLYGNGHATAVGKENTRPQTVGIVESANAEVKVGTAEISGKWLCPQKKKPYIAPPMKQLRLERWVHRFC